MGKEVRIVTVLGARPQFIKASVVSAALRAIPNLHEYVVHTGQHFDGNMSDVFFDELGMAPPDVNLGINGGGHGAMTGRMLADIEAVLLANAPDAVLVYGDTNSTLAGALAAAKLHIPVAHVEAGLRSFNRRMPEEINRVVTDHVSSWLFAPTGAAAAHLRHEGIGEATIHEVGDVMYDVALHHGRRADARGSAVLDAVGVRGRPYVLATIHRQENTNDIERLRAIVDAFAVIAAELAVVWPLHPRTRRVLQANGLLADAGNGVLLIEPQGYLDMVELERRAAVIVTDSGGIQKEAFFHRVPCVTLRDETEWVELLDLGWNRLVPPMSAEKICDAVRAAIGSAGQEGTPYGDGHAADRIAALLAGSRP